MEFIIRDMQHSVRDIEDLCRYKLLHVMGHSGHGNNLELARSLSDGAYPRFRLSVEILNGGDHGHRFTLWFERSVDSRERQDFGPEVEKEMRRIKEILTTGA